MVGTLTSRDHALVLDLQQRIAALQSDVNDFPNVGTLQAEVDALEVTIAALQAENVALESDIGVLEFNVAALQTANTTLTATVTALTATVTSLEAEIDALQTELGVLDAMIDPGNDLGMMDWGQSGKANAINQDSPNGHAGYDREFDRVFLGGQGLISTLNDAATLILARMQNENPGSSTGWDGSTGVARIDFVAIDKNGNVIYPNGADSAFATLTTNLIIPDSGDDAVDGHGDLRVSVINELESSVTKPPRDVLRVTGENGGEIWATSYNSAGAVVTNTKLFP